MTKNCLNRFTTSSPVNEIWVYIKSRLHQMEDECIPSKLTSTKYHQPWLNKKVKTLGHRKKRWWKKSKTSAYAKQIFSQIKIASRQECRKAMNNYLDNMFSEGKGVKSAFGDISKVASRRQLEWHPLRTVMVSPSPIV